MKKTGVRELAVLSRQLATMIRAGIPLLQCLNILIKQSENNTLSVALAQVSEDLANGLSFGDALREHPKVFPSLFVSMVKSGERSGTLELVFHQLGRNLQKEWELAAKIKSALLYPAAIVLVSIISVLILLLFVVPQFAMIFSGMTVTLPLVTRLLIGVSNGFRDYWYILLLSGAIVVLIIVRFMKSERGQVFRDRLIFRVPLFGELAHKIIIMRFCRSLSSLLQAGISVLSALELVRGITGNRLITDSIRSAEDSIREGSGLAAPLGGNGLFPPLVVNMIAVGEETGAVDVMLEQTAGFYEQEAEEMATRLTSLIEPVLITGVGCFVAFIVLSIMLPVFTIINHLE